jgi:hypothetical protein
MSFFPSKGIARHHGGRFFSGLQFAGRSADYRDGVTDCSFG